MEIAIRTVGYVVLAFISITLLFSILPNMSKQLDQTYCSALKALFIDSSCSSTVPSYTISNEDELAAAIVSCSYKTDQYCATIYLARELDSDKVLTILDKAGVEISLSLNDIDKKEILSIKNKDGTVIVG